MSLFSSYINDLEDDIFGMRHMHNNMNNMMNSLFSNPFGAFGNIGGPLGIMGPRHGSSFMPMMPQMPNMNALLSGNMRDFGVGSSYSSSTVFMSSGPGGRPQVIHSTSSTKVGPNGIKETKSTLEDSRSGTKKMAIGHHIGDRGHVMEKAQNTYSGDLEENEEYINIEEDEADDFDREFREKAGGFINRHNSNRRPLAITGSLPAIQAAPTRAHSALSSTAASNHKTRRGPRSSPLTSPHPSIREVYSPTQPGRRRPTHSHHSRHSRDQNQQ